MYGIPNNSINPVEKLETIIKARKEKAYGEQIDYFDERNCIGWTRTGDDEHINSGLAVLISNLNNSEKRMYVGERYFGKVFIDILGNCSDEVVIDEAGFGIFKVNAKTTSVYTIKG